MMHYVACCCLCQDLYGGFINTQLSEDFAYYADIVFEHLGPYVQHWLTFNVSTGTGVGAVWLSWCFELPCTVESCELLLFM